MVQVSMLMGVQRSVHIYIYIQEPFAVYRRRRSSMDTSFSSEPASFLSDYALFLCVFW